MSTKKVYYCPHKKRETKLLKRPVIYVSNFKCAESKGHESHEQ